MSENLSLIPEKNRPPETPITSLGHELGIMFGFMAACVVIVVIYVIFWRAAEKREEAHQAHRRERLAAQHARDYQARGGGGIGGVHEKMADAEGSGERRVELPGCSSLGEGVYSEGGGNSKTTAGHPGAMMVGGTRFEFEFGFGGGDSPGPGAGSGAASGGGGQGYGQRV
ncbi:uncharacterized protein BDW47DRAFT_123625 [Aspergillus candidus]|uniref:Uncharacterized protein n=1 Tax=Aspergillus candidus TaxID=41067 RepID=A0A2I2FJ17_ASPCN|nr:hypothetical protein BDW47DRAFT_123625 [Aspergillus candidus]PLB40613.1 hypothetical protein BDW47DRAFT_123625 [Aspergillus candidus]